MFLSKVRKACRSFSVQLTAWLLVLLTATTLIDFSLSHRVISSTLRSHDEQELFNELDEYSAAYRAGGAKGISDKADYEYRRNGTLLLIVRLLNRSGDVVFSNDAPLRGRFDFDKLRTVPIDEREVLTLEAKPASANLEVVRRRFSDGSELLLGATTEGRDEILASVNSLFGLTLIPVLLFTGIGGLFLSRHTLAPVRQLIALLQSILQTGQLTARAPLRGAEDELDSLSSLFNSLLERISILVETMKHSLDNVAHDLRTPMTRFRGTAELALRESDPAVLRESLVSAIEESEKILTTLHTLMDISEAEAGAMTLKLQPYDLALLVERVISLYEFVADEKQVTVRSSVPTGIIVYVDVDRMTQALANLLDNGLKYTLAGGTVEFAAKAGVATVELSISDTGIGIDPDDRPHIFERLYRSDKSRSTKGFGLGLSLVLAIARAHRTSIEVDSTPKVGSTFRVNLPLYSDINEI